MGLEKGENEMSSVNDLLMAIMNRDFDRDEIEADIVFVKHQIDMLRTYFDMAYKETYGSSVAVTLVKEKQITEERYKEYIAGLETRRTNCLDTAIAACAQINKMCDQYGLQHLCPDVEYDKQNGNKCVNQNEITEFIGEYMKAVFEQGQEDTTMEQVETE